MTSLPFVGAMDVFDSVCEHCGGVPQADWLPFWTYDEFEPCTCPDKYCVVCKTSDHWSTDCPLDNFKSGGIHGH